MTSTDTLAQLEDMGVAIWLDDISRERLTTGNLASLARDMHVSGVTSNPTIFAKALSSGSAYADQVADLALRGVSLDEAARALTTYDIRWACDVLRPKFDASDGSTAGFRSKSTRGWPGTPARPLPRPGPCGGWWTGRTCSSSPGDRGLCRRSRSACPRASASTSR